MDADSHSTPDPPPAPIPASQDDLGSEARATDEARTSASASAPEAPAPDAEQAIPLTEAAFLVGVSVQALRQRIKRGTLIGTEAVDVRGLRVAGVLPTDLRTGFPGRSFEALGARRSNLEGEGSPGQSVRNSGGAQAGGSSWDADASFERGGMAPPLERAGAAVGRPVADERSGSAWSIGPWSVGLLVALAAVAVAGLMTGAREARAAGRTLEDARTREIELLDQLRELSAEYGAARAEIRSLRLELDALQRDR